MLVFIIDRCDQYNSEGVLMKLQYLIVLRSLVPIVVRISIVSIPSLALFTISISAPFWLGRTSLGVYLTLSSQKDILAKFVGL